MNAAEFAVYSRREWRAPVYRFPSARYTTLPEDLIYDGSNRVQVQSDKSGNSSTNVLCLNASTTNYASVPHIAAYNVTDFDFAVRVMLPDYTPAADITLLDKRATTTGWSWLIAAGGAIQLLYYQGGVGVNVFSAANTLTDYTRYWLRVTRVAATGAVVFYYAPDSSSVPSSWTTITSTSGASGAYDTNSQVVAVGVQQAGLAGAARATQGNFARARILDGVEGSAVLEANFTAQSKLATSFTESSVNAATVTINTSGDFGARISGARDLVNMTVANQGIYTAPVGAAPGYITEDGSNDCRKSAAFPLSQPETVYGVFSQVTWTNGDAIYDGNANQTLLMYQSTTTPRIDLFANGTGFGAGSDLAVATRAIITSVFNGAASLRRTNRLAAFTGTVGSVSANGFILGCNGNISAFSNITDSEIVIYGAAHDEIAQQRMARQLMRQNRIPMSA